MRKNKIFQNVAIALATTVLAFGNAANLLAEPARPPCILDDAYELENPSESADAAGPAAGGGPTLEALFDPMPPPSTERGRFPRTYHLGRGISFHMCWCWGLRVLSYDPEEDFNGWQYDRFTFWQDETTRNLIITDNQEFVAFFDAGNDLTSTLSYEGTRSHRFGDFSVYFYSCGNVTFASRHRIAHFRLNWVWQTQYFGDENLPMPLSQIMEIDDRFMQLIGFNFFRLGAWNKNMENAQEAQAGSGVEFQWLVNPHHISYVERGMNFDMVMKYFIIDNIPAVYLLVDLDDVGTYPITALVSFREAAKTAAGGIYEEFGFSIDGMVGYMHLDFSPQFGTRWVGFIVSEEHTPHTDAHELFHFLVDAFTGEIIELHMNTPETPFRG